MKLTLTRNELGILNAATQFSEMEHQCEKCGYVKAKTRWVHGHELSFSGNIVEQIKDIVGSESTIPDKNHEIEINDTGVPTLVEWVENMKWAANDALAVAGLVAKLTGKDYE